MTHRAFIGITGASGAAYSLSLLRILREHGWETWVSATEWGLHTLKTETGLGLDELRGMSDKLLDFRDMNSEPASGSAWFSGVAVVPATVSTVAKIAAGVGDNLITRAAGVALKQKNRLVVVIRETPVSALHLEAMTKLALAGAVVMPASPGFYHKPKSLEDLVEFVAARAAKALGLKMDIPWTPEME